MTNKNKYPRNSIVKTFHFKDDSGYRLDIAPDQKIKNGIRLNLVHENLTETNQRQEFEIMTITIDSNYPELFEAFKEFVIMTRSDIYISKDPIRDGRNEMIVKLENDVFYVTFVHDFANEFRKANKTGIVLQGREIENFYQAMIKTTTVPVKTVSNDCAYTTEEIEIFELDSPKVYKLMPPLTNKAA